MAGYCFRCDVPAEGEVCPRCGSVPYWEKEAPARRRRPMRVGEAVSNRSARVGLKAIVAIVLLLIAIAFVAASTAGVS